MAKSIYKLVDDLPKNNLTVRMLKAMDMFVPGRYTNIVGFENMIRTVSGETDEDMIQKIGERAVALYNDKKQRYARAVWLYGMGETASNMVGAASLANKVGTKWRLLRFLKWLTPRADTSQGLDFAIKTVLELLAFTSINGIPGDRVGDFVKALANYRDEALMRMVTLIAVDGLVPLGPNYLKSALDALSTRQAKKLEKNETFQQIESLIPGGQSAKLDVIRETIEGAGDWMQRFAAEHDLTQESVIDRLRQFIEVTDDRLDYLAAFIDLTTNYYEHTGVQTVARQLISRAMHEV